VFQSAARGERDPGVRAHPQGAAEGVRAVPGAPHEDQGHPGTRHLRQGEQPQNRLPVLHGHAQRFPHGPQSRPHFPNAHMLTWAL